jgi:hypothetical protein
MRSANKISTGKSREKGKFGDQEGSIKMNVREINSEDGAPTEVVEDCVHW